MLFFSKTQNLIRKTALGSLTPICTSLNTLWNYRQPCYSFFQNIVHWQIEVCHTRETSCQNPLPHQTSTQASAHSLPCMALLKPIHLTIFLATSFVHCIIAANMTPKNTLDHYNDNLIKVNNNHS